MESSVENIRLGACRAIYDNTSLGLTKGGVELAISTQAYNVNVDQYGAGSINEFVTARTITVKIPLAETQLDLFAKVMPGTQLIGTTNKKLEGLVSTGVSLRDFCKPLILRSATLAPDDSSQDIVIPLAAPKGDINFSFKHDEERVYTIEFTGYVNLETGQLFYVNNNESDEIPAPFFMTQPTVSPSSGTVGTTFTATPGTVENGSITSRTWLLNGTAISTTLSATPDADGTLTYREYATGEGGETSSTLRVVNVAALPVPVPTISLSSAVTNSEGNSGTTDFVWTVTLNRDGSTDAIPYTWAITGSGSNPADAADFGGTFPSGSGTFAAGETSKTITVIAMGDTAVEPDDTFTLTVNGPNTVTSTGTISNDDVEPVEPTAQLRTITSNMIGQASDGGANRLTQAFRWSKPIGSGDVSEIVFSHYNWFSSSGTESVYADTMTVEMYACYNGVAVPVKRDGAFPVVVPAGANDYHCDPLYPSDFGVSVFTRGTEVEIRGLASRPVGTANPRFPTAQTLQTGSSSKFETLYLDSDGSVTGSAQSITNLQTPGVAFAISGGSKYQRASGYMPIMLGKFVSGDPRTELLEGDSIDVGLSANASSGGLWGMGRNAASTHDGDGSNFYAYLSVAVGGSVVTHFTGTNTLTHPYIKYCRFASGAHLTNSFGATGTGKTASEMLALMRERWAILRANGIEKILALGAQTRGTSTDSWATEQNQTIGAGWQAGGNVEQYYVLMQGEIDAGRIDGFRDFQSWRGTDRNKWKIDPVHGKGTSDSTHPLGWVHDAEAAELRPVKAAIFDGVEPTPTLNNLTLSEPVEIN